MHLKQPEFKYTSCGTFRGRLHERRTELKAARDFSTIKLFIGLHEKSVRVAKTCYYACSIKAFYLRILSINICAGTNGVFTRTVTKVHNDYFLTNSLNGLISIQGRILLSFFRILKQQQEMVNNTKAGRNLQLTKYIQIKRIYSKRWVTCQINIRMKVNLSLR